MKWLLSFVVGAAVAVAVSRSAAIEQEDIVEQGLYSKSDHVVILARSNFDRKVYNQKHATVIQFYNSFCGHCRHFAPRFKAIAAEVVNWKNIVQLTVIDCSVEDNTELCRQFDVLAYPSLRILPANYQYQNGNIGEKLVATESVQQFKDEIIHHLQNEQAEGRLMQAPPLGISSYISYVAVMNSLPSTIFFAFLVFENNNSTVGSEIILNTSDYPGVRVIRVDEHCELANLAGISHSPALVAVTQTLEHTPLTPKIPTTINLLNAINTYLKTKKYVFPSRDHSTESPSTSTEVVPLLSADVVYYADLEKTIKTALTTEITRYNSVTGEQLEALMNFLNILIDIFPFRGYGREYVTDLRNALLRKTEWSGSDIYDIVKNLETKDKPVYISNLEYIGCKGSNPKYRGYSCGLWTLFHTLTVNAAPMPGNKGPKVLQAMHGYIKHFFGCTECSEHFQAMAERNRIFDVNENEKAVLWLWIAHNEVNLRLAGDVTEDPMYPKQQFPSAAHCRECRQARGAWRLPAVYQYLQQMYGAANLHVRAASRAPLPSALTNLDLGMLSLLYILSFVLIIVVIKLFLTKRLYRKKVYMHDNWGKV